MYTFTNQQLAGHGGMNSKVKIGNWWEDQEYEEKQLQDFLKRKETGNLTCQIVSRKLSHHTKETILHIAGENGKVEFGKTCLLFNHKTKGFLSVDLDTKLHHANNAFGVTTTPSEGPCQRNTFIIEKVKKSSHDKSGSLMIPESEANILHYGQPFVIHAYPEFFPKELFLHSQKKCFGTSSPLSLGQQVCMREGYGYETVWRMIYRDPKYRLEFEGEPVDANHPVIIVHAATGVNLSSHEKRLSNDFGHECEVSCDLIKSIHKVEKDESVWEIVYGKQTVTKKESKADEDD